MLSKEICKKCWDVTNSPWNERDEDRWERIGIVWCPDSEEGYSKVMGNPCTVCPYTLEHLLKGDTQNGK